MSDVTVWFTQIPITNIVKNCKLLLHSIFTINFCFIPGKGHKFAILLIKYQTSFLLVPSKWGNGERNMKQAYHVMDLVNAAPPV